MDYHWLQLIPTFDSYIKKVILTAKIQYDWMKNLFAISFSNTQRKIILLGRNMRLWCAPAWGSSQGWGKRGLCFCSCSGSWAGGTIGFLVDVLFNSCKYITLEDAEIYWSNLKGHQHLRCSFSLALESRSWISFRYPQFWWFGWKRGLFLWSYEVMISLLSHRSYFIENLFL